MKTQIIFECPKPAAVQESSVNENRNTEVENEIKKALFLALLEKGLITRVQYELCLGKNGKNGKKNNPYPE